jgi:hypothetical protein
MNTDREDLRLLITEFNDGPMGSAYDFAWRRHLKTYEYLLAEVVQLREENERLQKAIRGCDSMKCTWLYEGTYKEMTKHD